MRTTPARGPRTGAYLNPLPVGAAMRHGQDPITIIAGAARHPAGPALVGRLVAAGHRVAIMDRRGAEARVLAASSKDLNPPVRLHEGAATDPRRIRRTIDDLLIHHGRIDHVIYLAPGLPPSKKPAGIETDLDAHVEANTGGPWHWLRAAIPLMAEHEGGRFVFVLRSGDPGDIGHAAARAATIAATNALASHLNADTTYPDITASVLVVDGLMNDVGTHRLYPDKTDWSDAVDPESVVDAIVGMLDAEEEADVPVEVRLGAQPISTPKRRRVRSGQRPQFTP